MMTVISTKGKWTTIYTGKKKKVEIIPYSYSKVYASDSGEIKFVTWADEKLNLHAAYRKSKMDQWREVSAALNFDANNIVVLSHILQHFEYVII